MIRSKMSIALMVGAVMMFGSQALAGFDSFVIRNGNTSGEPPTIQPNDDYVTGATEFIISETGMKAGWGSDDLNGYTIGDIARLYILRHDDTNRDGLTAGGKVAPYFNIWITDGTNYAVVANEPSNPAFQPLFEDDGNAKKYDLSFDDLKDKVAKVYETAGWNDNTSWVHTAVGKTGQTLTFADLANFEIGPPSADYITASQYIGSGAPRELETNKAYGFTWVFGDTQSNYTSGDDGYIVSNPLAQPVPEPGMFVLLAGGGLALGGVVLTRRRKNKKA